MKCVILQPSYIPWRGYFHQILQADVFVFYDDVQYDKRGWRNRNRIKTPTGPRWLTIPVHSRGAQIEKTPINAIKIAWNRPWNQEHWRTLEVCYRRAPYFDRFAPLLEPFYSRRPDLLADFTIDLTVALAREMGITHVDFCRASSLNARGAKTDRLIEILTRLGAKHYLSGPSARSYIEPEKFAAAGIEIEYMRYDYPQYPQLYPPYDPQVSILDLLFMTGPEALHYIDPRGSRDEALL